MTTKRFDERKPFDPDAGEKVAQSMTAHDLAVRLMREIKETPSSQYQTLVGKAIQQVTDWEPEWSEIELLIDRISREPLDVLNYFVADDEAVGAHRCDSMLGIQTMPPGYALMLNSDSTHFYWLREDGCCSAIHWDKWKIYLWAKQDFTNQQVEDHV